MKKITLFAILFVSFVAHASKTADIRSEVQTCTGETAIGSLGMRECVAKGREKADTLLEKTLADVRAISQKTISDVKSSKDDIVNAKETLKRLEASQTAWADYRGKECSYQATDALGGFDEILIDRGCQLEMILLRVEALGGGK